MAFPALDVVLLSTEPNAEPDDSVFKNPNDYVNIFPNILFRSVSLQAYALLDETQKEESKYSSH